jgi:hypothetical protein
MNIDKEAIRSIRNGKTASTDLISNEMLKNAVPILIKPLQKLFNLIFKNGTFPKSFPRLELIEIPL